MSMTFNDIERAAMQTMGLPTDIDEIFARGEEYYDATCQAIEDELLGPGLEDNGMDLNPYGVALRSALDAIACREREIAAA